MLRLLHFTLMVTLAVYAVGSGLRHIATCESSEDYQPGIDHLRFLLNPIAGLCGMLLCSVAFRRAVYWVQFEKTLIAASVFFVAAMIVLVSLDEDACLRRNVTL